jgi:hypothetical protein
MMKASTKLGITVFVIILLSLIFGAKQAGAETITLGSMQCPTYNNVITCDAVPNDASDVITIGMNNSTWET